MISTFLYVYALFDDISKLEMLSTCNELSPLPYLLAMLYIVMNELLPDYVPLEEDSSIEAMKIF